MKNKCKAPRNKTIGLSRKEIKRLKSGLIKIRKLVLVGNVLNRVINQDIFEIIDFLPSNFVDLLFVDPPYNLTKRFNHRNFKEMTMDGYKRWMESWLKKMVRLLKPTASIYICGDWRSSAAVHMLCEKYFLIRNRITFEREKGRGSKKNWKSNSEDIWFSTVSNNYTFNAEKVKLKRRVIAPYRMNGKPKSWVSEGKGKYRLTYSSNIWNDITIPFWSMSENTPHPTQKPEKLLAKIILASSNKDDVIFDPFSGVGTTGVVAKKLGRNFVIIEIDEKYCLYAMKRLEMAENNLTIQGYSGGVFWERNTIPITKPKNNS